MSENEKEKGVEKEYDPRLDFYSEKFDALYALSVENFVLPCPKAKVYDNMNAYERAQLPKPDTSAANEQRQKEKAPAETEAGPSTGRRFLPHQMPVATSRKKEHVDLFGRMEKMEGPLKLLMRCVEEKLKVKIWTRNARTIRGYCTAYVTAFDKHWNLALSDVEEVWKRPKRRKTVAIESDVNNTFRPRRKLELPVITVVKDRKKHQICSRKVKQYILRGEHIALIAVLNQENKIIQ